MERSFIIENGMRRPSADVEIASSLVDPGKRSASGELALDNFVNLVSRDGYALIAGSQMCALLEEVGLQDWDTFKDIPRLIEEPAEVSCIFRLGGFLFAL
jgi:hypothetical protein